jgi:hypothetical protein
MAAPESGFADGVSPELILVSEEDVAERARADLAPIVPTDERLLAESSARVRAGLRVAQTVAPEPSPIPVRQPPPPVTEPPAPPPPAPAPRKRPRTRLRIAGAVALVPIAAVGAALGAGWNPVSSGGSSPSPATQAAPPPPAHVGTATSHVTPTTVPSQTHHASTQTPVTTHHQPRTVPATHATPTTTPAHHRPPPAHTTPRATTTAPAATHPKPPPPNTGPIKPSRVFAWPAAPNATFYLVRFLRDGVQVFQDRVAAPRLTLPAKFVLKAGHYRWTVLPALGTAKNPRYGPAIVDSQFDVAG